QNTEADLKNHPDMMETIRAGAEIMGYMEAPEHVVTKYSIL
ncbi:hypothetical protein KIPB_015950, partial [Kipferlia bialata]